MPLIERSVDWTQLISFSNGGLVVADFVQIKKSLIELFKTIYGSDIDVSTGTADGIYIDNIALLINNIFQSFKAFVSQLDVNTAYGKYLENLCRLTNVSRKSATYSNTYLLCKSTEKIEITKQDLPLKFLDDEGNTWSYNEPITFEPNIEQSLLVTCDTIGPVRARKGSINKLVNTIGVLQIVQENDASVGSYSETDSQLRSRRNQYLGNYGNTVLESLANSLISISGIDDIKIYNNNSQDNINAKDGTEILPHNVYIILRKRQNVVIEDSLIGSIIYQKMTPGILTTETTDSTYGVSKNYKYSSLIEEINQNVYWKEAKPDKPVITIEITLLNNFASNQNQTLNNIAQNVIDYLNNLSLEDDIKIYNVLTTAINSDIKFRGLNTFTLNYDSIKIANANTDYVNKGTYYDYSIEDVAFSDSGSNKVITFN